MTIVSLRGTHGSGKSSVVKAVLNRYPHFGIDPSPRGKVEGYAVNLSTGWLYVRGSYHTACGGCDGIQPYADIWPQIEWRMDSGWEEIKFSHCLFEGALVSSGYGNLGRATEKYGDDVVFAFLDTPLELCLQRIAERRLARHKALGKPGKPEPVNPKNTADKHVMVEKSMLQIAALGRRTKGISHVHPVKDVMRLFGVKLLKEPTL